MNEKDVSPRILYNEMLTTTGTYVDHPYNFILGVSSVSVHETVKLYSSPKPQLLVVHVWIIYGVRQPPVYSSQPHLVQ